MMEVKDFKETFKNIMVGDSIILRDKPSKRVDINDFARIFKDVKDLSYEGFMEVNGYSDEDLGYKTFFDKCKEEGILK